MNNGLYLILLSIEVDRELLIKKFEEANLIDTWFFAFPNSLFIRTKLNSKEIWNFIEENVGSKLCLITAVTDDYYGRLNVDLWKKFDKVKTF
jgi:hypothetical protein